MAFSKLLNGDAEEFTPAQAGAQFAAEAKRIAEEQNIDIAKAWKIAKSLHPEAFTRLCEGGKPNVTLANSAEKVKRDALTKDYANKFNKALRDCNNDPIRAHAIVMKQMNEAETQPLDNASLQDLFNKNGLNTVTMGLGMQNKVTADEFAVAWKAIGGKITPNINFKAMFNALTGFVVGKENVSVPAARAAVAERFPVLASKCGLLTSVMKIQIPAALRSRIETYLTDNKSEQEASAALREKLTGELADLETEVAKLVGQIPQLRAAALKNSADTAAFQNAETRQRLIAERINELRGQLENIRPVSLALAESILTDAVGFYSETLPPLIMDALAPFCPTPSAARRLVKFTDAIVQLRSVQNFASRLIHLPANSGVIARIETILQRALRGEPLLFGDVAETEAGQ